MFRGTRGITKETASVRFIGMDVPDEIGLPLIWARIQKKLRKSESGCWLWTGFILPTGYVQISYQGRRSKAHHLAHMANKGPVPEGKVVMHSCDVRHCLNPAHLSLGTQSENIIDAVTKGRQFHRAKTHCPQGHEYAVWGRFHTTTDPRQNSPWRVCTRCQRIHSRRRAGWPEHMLDIDAQPLGYRPTEAGHRPPGGRRKKVPVQVDASTNAKSSEQA